MTVQMTRAQKVQAAIFLDELAATAAEHAKRLKGELGDEARDELAAQGAAPTWRMPDVATVAARMSRGAVYVADRDKFAAWAAERHPTEVYTAVRPAFETRTLKTVKNTDAGLVDKQGEVVPGLASKPGGMFLGVSVTPTDAARQVFGGLAADALFAVAASAAPAVFGSALAELVAGEQCDPVGHLDPRELG